MLCMTYAKGTRTKYALHCDYVTCITLRFIICSRTGSILMWFQDNFRREVLKIGEMLLGREVVSCLFIIF